jgi:hypothetical protein
VLVVHPAINSSRSPGMPRRDRVGRHTRPVTSSRGGRRPTVVQLVAEHTDFCLWNDSPEAPLHGDDYALEPADLGVSPELCERLVAWNDRYGQLALTGYEWPSHEEERAWRQTGLHLAHELQDELGPDVDVVYAEDGDPRPVRERRGP